MVKNCGINPLLDYDLFCDTHAHTQYIYLCILFMSFHWTIKLLWMPAQPQTKGIFHQLNNNLIGSWSDLEKKKKNSSSQISIYNLQSLTLQLQKQIIFQLISIMNSGHGPLKSWMEKNLFVQQLLWRIDHSLVQLIGRNIFKGEDQTFQFIYLRQHKWKLSIYLVNQQKKMAFIFLSLKDGNWKTRKSQI